MSVDISIPFDTEHEIAEYIAYNSDKAVKINVVSGTAYFFNNDMESNTVDDEEDDEYTTTFEEDVDGRFDVIVQRKDGNVFTNAQPAEHSELSQYEQEIVDKDVVIELINKAE